MAITYLEAIREAQAKALADDDSVYIYGQDVAAFGGAFKATKNLAESFPGRVIDAHPEDDAFTHTLIEMFMVEANEAAARRHFQGLVSEQSHYNLLTRHVELEVLPAAEAYGIGIIPWSPLNGGALAGALRKQAEGQAARASTGRAEEVLRTHRAAIEAYEKFCADLGHDPVDVGVAWLLAQPAVTAPVRPPTMRRSKMLKNSSAGSIDSEVKARTAAVSTEYCDANACTPSGSVYLLGSTRMNSGSM